MAYSCNQKVPADRSSTICRNRTECISSCQCAPTPSPTASPSTSPTDVLTSFPNSIQVAPYQETTSELHTLYLIIIILLILMILVCVIGTCLIMKRINTKAQPVQQPSVLVMASNSVAVAPTDDGAAIFGEQDHSDSEEMYIDKVNENTSDTTKETPHDDIHGHVVNTKFD